MSTPTKTPFDAAIAYFNGTEVGPLTDFKVIFDDAALLDGPKDEQVGKKIAAVDILDFADLTPQSKDELVSQEIDHKLKAMASVSKEVSDFIGKKATYNFECEECVKKGYHCGTCPNPECEPCSHEGEWCGYCNWGENNEPDNAVVVQHRLERDGEAQDWVVRVAKGNELQIDCDSMADVQYCLKQMKVLAQAIPINRYVIIKSRSGNRHVLIKTEKSYLISARIAIQACLGSDKLRELLSMVAYKNGKKNTILLVVPKENPQLEAFDNNESYEPSINELDAESAGMGEQQSNVAEPTLPTSQLSGGATA